VNGRTTQAVSGRMSRGRDSYNLSIIERGEKRVRGCSEETTRWPFSVICSSSSSSDDDDDGGGGTALHLHYTVCRKKVSLPNFFCKLLASEKLQ